MRTTKLLRACSLQRLEALVRKEEKLGWVKLGLTYKEGLYTYQAVTKSTS